VTGPSARYRASLRPRGRATEDRDPSIARSRDRGAAALKRRRDIVVDRQLVRIDGAYLQHHGISMLMSPCRKRVITFDLTDQADRQLSIELPLRAEACVVRLHPVHPGSPAEG